MRPTLGLAGHAVSTFHFCGIAGFVSAMATAAFLGLPPLLLFALAGAGVLTFLAVILIERALLGQERIVRYHHDLAFLVVSASLSALLGYPVLRQLDVLAVALGVFMAWGRLGCWMVGCCHGRPHRLGLRYGEQHAKVGFPSCLVGVPLVPVQLAELIAVLGLTTVNALHLRVPGTEPGMVVATQWLGYALLRFVLEFLRGDAERPSWNGLTEAQWTSIGIALAIAGAERWRVLPPSDWHMLAAVAVTAVAGSLVWQRRRAGSLHRLFSPSHTLEVIRALQAETPARETGPTAVRTTSLGVRISASSIDHGPHGSRLYTLSAIDPRAARRLAELVLTLQPSTARSHFLEARPRLFHVIVTPASEGTSFRD
jgi:Prolipoprotein diacylglyceryl transferase